MITKTSSIYFPGLNGLRFLAALAVIITHIELMKDKLGFENAWHEPIINQLGVIGVSFFFVLSGFLITYLLLTENEKTKNISVKHFYIRRILRIWPLYYFILVIGFFILPYFSFFEVPFFSEHFREDYFWNLIFYIIIFPNLAYSIFAAVPLIGQSWSIGVEEQFYILWPLIVKCKKTLSFKFLISILIFIVVIKLIILISFNLSESHLIEYVKKFAAMAKFENMIIGAIGALIIKNNIIWFLNFIYKPIILLGSIFSIFISIYLFPDELQDGAHVFHAFLFLIIILNVSTNPNSFLKLENYLFNLLGKISYGIYMYHLIVIFVVIKYLSHINFLRFTTIWSNLLLYILSIGITIIVAYLSYNFLELRFLKIKNRFTKIKSGNP